MTPVADKVKTATHWRRVFALTVFGALMLAALAFANSGRAAIETPPPPSVWSDKADYAPGEQVSLSGANWAPGESVHIRVNDDAGETWRRDVDVTADESGAISDQFNLPDWFVAQYSVTATGASRDGDVELHGRDTATSSSRRQETPLRRMSPRSVNWDLWQGTGITANNNCNGASEHVFDNGTATYTGKPTFFTSGTGYTRHQSTTPRLSRRAPRAQVRALSQHELDSSVTSSRRSSTRP